MIRTFNPDNTVPYSISPLAVAVAPPPLLPPLYHVNVLVLWTHVVEPVRTEGLRRHRSTGGQSKVRGRVPAVAHVVVGLPRLVVEVVHLRVVGRGCLVVVRVLVVLIVPEVVRLVIRHIAQRVVGSLRRDWRGRSRHD